MSGCRGAFVVVLWLLASVGASADARGVGALATAPVPAYTAAPTAGPVPLTVWFADASTNGATSWTWDFGDGVVSLKKSPDHTYTTPGYYTVTLTVANRAGAATVSHPFSIAAGFPDMTTSHFAFYHAISCFEANIVKGYPDGGYHSGILITRAQMAVYLSRGLMGSDAAVPPGPGTPTFPDVPTTHYAYSAIEFLYSRGIIRGYWDGYHPDEIVNRAQMALYTARVIAGGDAKVPPGPATPTFPDVTPDGPWGWAYKYVEYIAAHHVAGGYADGCYRPSVQVCRGQMAVYTRGTFNLPMYKQ